MTLSTNISIIRSGNFLQQSKYNRKNSMIVFIFTLVFKCIYIFTVKALNDGFARDRNTNISIQFIGKFKSLFDHLNTVKKIQQQCIRFSKDRI